LAGICFGDDARVLSYQKPAGMKRFYSKIATGKCGFASTNPHAGKRSGLPGLRLNSCRPSAGAWRKSGSLVRCFGCRALARRFGTQLFHALRTNAVGKVSARGFVKVSLHLIPVSLVIADALAPGADGQQSLQSFDMIQGFRQMG